MNQKKNNPKTTKKIQICLTKKGEDEQTTAWQDTSQATYLGNEH